MKRGTFNTTGLSVFGHNNTIVRNTITRCAYEQMLKRFRKKEIFKEIHLAMHRHIMKILLLSYRIVKFIVSI